MQGAVNNIVECIGNTPIVRLNRLGAELKATIYCKLGFMNPGGSVKDRVAVNIIDEAERAGLLRPGGTIVEATSGNTGMGLAMVAASRGYKCIFVMPDKQSESKMKALRALGAEVIVTPTDVPPDDPRSYYSVSRRIAQQTEGAFYANQYHNQANPRAHYKSTGPEIWRQTAGDFDAFVAGLGTGGTMTGVGKYLKERNPDIALVGADIEGSVYYDYWKSRKIVTPHTYLLEGIGEDFFPDTIDLDLIDRVYQLTDRECFETTRALARLEGIFAGGSSGAAVAAAIRYARDIDRQANILVLLPDGGCKYLEKVYDDDWLRQHGMLEEERTEPQRKVPRHQSSPGFETRAIHAGQDPDPATGAICTPVYLTSTYQQASPGVTQGFDYSRVNNPTRLALEKNLASLENARHGICFSSGCAAAAALAHWLGPDKHMIVGNDVYGGTHRLFAELFADNRRAFTFTDLTTPDAWLDHVTDATRAVWVETPSNPLLEIVDLERIASQAHERGLVVIVDNTFASPYFQQPLRWGADVVVHSATKYLGGHSDVILGAVVTNDDDIAERLRFIGKSTGGVPGPLDAYLVLRGTKTLAVRMRQHEQNAMRIAEWLENHPKVRRVLYPGLTSHPQHELARKQMTGFGGMITFELAGGLAEARAMLTACQLFTLAESLGGVESLIEHPAIMTHASLPSSAREKLGISDGLIRLSVGIENVDDLLADLENALSAV